MGAQRRGGRSVLAALAAMVTVGLALAGCGDPEPAPGPGPTAPGSSSASPEPSDSSSAAQAETPEEFIRRWAEANTEMQNTGDAASFLTLSRDCQACTDLATLVKGFYKRGGFVKTDGWTILKITRERGSPDREPVFFVDVDSAPTQYRRSAGGALTTLPGGKAQHRFTLVRASDGYRVRDFMEVSK